MSKVIFRPQARKEVREAFDHYAAESADVAADFLAEIERLIERAASHAQEGSPYSQGTRRFLLGRFPYSFIYSVEQDAVVVVAVAHYRRKPDYWLRRVR